MFNTLSGVQYHVTLLAIAILYNQLLYIKSKSIF